MYGYIHLSHLWMWELDHKESWAQKNWCFWTVALEKTLESPLDGKEFKPVNPKGNQSWLFIGRNDVEAETPILWPPDKKNWLHSLERLWCWERLKAGGEGEDRGWDHWMASLIQWIPILSEQALGVGDGHRRLAYCSSWGHKGLDTTEWLN